MKQQISVRVPEQDLRQLMELATKEGLDVSDIIRRSIRELLARIARDKAGV